MIVTLQYTTRFTESRLLAAQSGNSLVAVLGKMHLLFCSKATALMGEQCRQLICSWMHVQASFAKWNEGQKDRPKQVNAALEAHKARVAAADAAAQQQKEAVIVRPVPKGKKEQPLELHPDQFVRIKAHKTAGNTSTSTAMLADLAEVTASPAVDVEVSEQKLLPQHIFSVGHTAQCSSNSCVF